MSVLHVNVVKDLIDDSILETACPQPLGKDNSPDCKKTFIKNVKEIQCKQDDDCPQVRFVKIGNSRVEILIYKGLNLVVPNG